MFVFGTPEEQAATYWDTYRNMGPGVPEIPMEEMSTKELRQAQVIAGLCFLHARKDGASKEVLKVLRYECWLIAGYQITHDDQVRAAVIDGAFKPSGVNLEGLKELAKHLNRNA